MDEFLRVDQVSEMNRAISSIIDRKLSGSISSGEILAPGLWLSFESDGPVVGSFETFPGMMISIKMNPSGKGISGAFHVALGESDLAEKYYLGFVARIQSPNACSFRVCLRSGSGFGFEDQYFYKPVISVSDPVAHLDVIPILNTHSVPLWAPWRELLLSFECRSIEFSLLDLRIFTV